MKEKIIESLGSAVFDTRLEELERRGLYRDIIVQFAKMDREEGVSISEATKAIPAYPGPYIRELEGKGYMTRINRGRYRVSDDLFRLWINEKYKNQNDQRSSRRGHT